jgi:HAD superfamily hydrolase (TIGR01450 family)
MHSGRGILLIASHTIFLFSMTPPVHQIQHAAGLLIDVGGTLRSSGRALPGAADFLHILKKRGTPFLIFSNNALVTPTELSDELRALDMPVHPEDVITSGSVTAQQLQAEGVAEAFIIGSRRFTGVLESHGITHSDTAQTVVVALDKELTYKKLMSAGALLANGARYIATHADATILSTNGPKPGTGATLAYLKAITNREPDVIIGKPYPPMLAVALEKLNAPASQLGIIGDRLDADMKMAQDNGLVSALVLSGATTQEEVAKSDYQPDYVVQSIENLTPLFA